MDAVGMGLRAKYPQGTPIEWSDETGSYLGLELPDGSRVVDTIYSHVPTADEQAAADAALAVQAAADNRSAALALLIDDCLVQRGSEVAAKLASMKAAASPVVKVPASEAVTQPIEVKP